MIRKKVDFRSAKQKQIKISSRNVNTIMDDFHRALPILKSLSLSCMKDKSDLDAADRRAVDDNLSVDHSNQSLGTYNQRRAYTTFLTKHSGEFRHLAQLVTLGLTMGTNAAGPERVMSKMNWIKNLKRNRLTDEMLQSILHIQLNGLSPEDVDYKKIVLSL